MPAGPPRVCGARAPSALAQAPGAGPAAQKGRSPGRRSRSRRPFRRHDGGGKWMPEAGEPGLDGVLELAQVTAARGTAGPANAREQCGSDHQENDVGRPHGPEWAHLAGLREWLAGDKPDVVQPEHAEADPDHEPDAGARKPQRDRGAEQDEDGTGDRDRELLLDLDVVGVERAVAAIDARTCRFETRAHAGE